MLSPEHASYLSKRGLSAETCAALGIETHGRHLAFSYQDGRGTVLFNKLRTLDKGFTLDRSGVALRLYNLPMLASVLSRKSGQTPRLIITEGEIDAASLVEVGYEAVTSVPNGAPNITNSDDIISPEQDRAFSYLWGDDDLRPELTSFKEYVLLVDNDAPGQRLCSELLSRLGPEKCYVVKPDDWPEGCKDANDVLVKYGPDCLRDLVDNLAQPFIEDRFVAPDDVPVQTAGERYLPGISGFKERMIICLPSLVVVTGKPGHGKSTFALNWMLSISRQYGVAGALIQFENDFERTRWEINAYVRAYRHDPDRDVVDPETGEVTGTKRNYARDPNFTRNLVRVIPPSAMPRAKRDLMWLRGLIKEAAHRHGCKWVIIDPWNEVEQIWDRNLREDQFLNAALGDLRDIAKDYGIALIIVAHPDKNSGRNETIEQMSLYSISGGSAWKNKADLGVVVEREKDGSGVFTQNSFIKIDKSRDVRRMGAPGTFKVEYDPKSNLYRNGVEEK
jgi:twinkle protein